MTSSTKHADLPRIKLGAVDKGDEKAIKNMNEWVEYWVHTLLELEEDGGCFRWRAYKGKRSHAERIQRTVDVRIKAHNAPLCTEINMYKPGRYSCDIYLRGDTEPGL